MRAPHWAAKVERTPETVNNRSTIEEKIRGPLQRGIHYGLEPGAVREPQGSLVGATMEVGAYRVRPGERGMTAESI